MAALRLDSDSEYPGLPEVCMKCGAPATVFKDKNFAWHPRWVFVLIMVHLLVYAIVAVIMTRKRRVRVPLCERHKNHWLGRQVVLLGSLLVLLLTGVGGFAVLADEGPGRRGNDLGGLLCLGVMIGFVLWLVLVAVLQSTAIRPQEITDRSITLKGVAEEFVRAHEGEWDRSFVRLDRAVRERWGERGRRPREEEGDRYRPPEAPDDHRPPPDAYREG